MPDQRLVLAPIRTTNRISSRPTFSSRLTFAVAGAAIALVATASGAAAFSAGASAHPAGAPGQPVSGAQSARAAQPVRAVAMIRPISGGAAATLPAAIRAGSSQAGSSQADVAVLDGSARPLILASGSHRTPKQKAWRILRGKGWSPRYQFPYLDKLWARESGWNVYADNPYSGAYGIPQAVPGSKMASAGPNWQSSAKTQIRWGLDYIRERYNSPRQAWLHEIADGWY